MPDTTLFLDSENQSTEEYIWNFKYEVDLAVVQTRLRELCVDWKMLSVTASYYFEEGPPRKVITYEALAEYTGEIQPDGDPETIKCYKRSDFTLAPTADRWIPLALEEEVSEQDFYNKVLYSPPQRVVNLQQMIFDHGSAEYTVELNLEAKTFVLIGKGPEAVKGSRLFGELLEDGVSKERYLIDVFGSAN